MQYFWIDWLRFLAAFLVVLSHARGAAFVEYGALLPEERGYLISIFYAITRLGHEAVIAFFVLSGFLVGGKLLIRVQKQSFCWRTYAVDRTTRIMLPLVPAIGFTLFASCLVSYPLSYFDVLGNLFSLQGVVVEPLKANRPLWSLAYEVWFYVLAGGAAAIFLGQGNLKYSGSLVLLSGAMFIFLSPVYLICWCMGALAYLRLPQRWNPVAAFIACLIVFCGITLCQLTSNTRLEGNDWLSSLDFLNRSFAELCLAIGVALLVRSLCGVRELKGNARSFEEIGARLAKSSYSLYLFHYPVIVIWAELGIKEHSGRLIDSPLLFILMISSSFFISFIFYYLFERNTIRLRLRILDNLSFKGNKKI